MPRAVEAEHDLFVSHSSADCLVTVHGRHFRLIDRLKKMLEEHYHPSERVNGRPRRFRVCTFEEDFQLTGQVKEAIEAQLERSRAVLVICSEASRDSRYVLSELEHFRAGHPDKPLIAGLWNVMPDEAFPEFFPDGTVGANLAPSVVASFDDWLDQLEDESHKIVAKAWRLSVAEVYDRFQAERKRKKKRLVAAVAVVTLFLAGLAGLAVRQSLAIRRAEAHDRAAIEMRAHGFQVDALGGGGNTVIFRPPPGSEFADPFQDWATRGLAMADGLVDVRSVRLAGPAVTDQTLAALGALPDVRRLWLQRVRVTDDSVPALAALDQLEELHLDRTQISPDGVSRLREALPDCEIDLSAERFVDLSGWDFSQELALVSEEEWTRRPQPLSRDEWQEVFAHAGEHAPRFGYPQKQGDSLLLGSFNIRKLDRVDRRTPAAWLFLAKVIHAFDLFAIQEVLSDLDGLRHLEDLLGPAFELTFSPPSGPIEFRERVAFFHNRQTVTRTELTGNILLDSRSQKELLYQHWQQFADRLSSFADSQAAGGSDRSRRPQLGRLILPKALGFMRTPFMASFELGKNGDPYRILAVNAHLQFGDRAEARHNAFELLTRLLIEESGERRRRDDLAYEDLMLFGDLNLDYDKPERDGVRIRDLFAQLSQEGRGSAIFFPFLDVHPRSENGEVFRSNARRNQTYDQIGFVAHDPRLATLASAEAGRRPDGFDYGVFDWVGLFLEALPERAPEEGDRRQLREFLRSVEVDVSDHLPIWVRLPAPE